MSGQTEVLTENNRKRNIMDHSALTKTALESEDKMERSHNDEISSIEKKIYLDTNGAKATKAILFASSLDILFLFHDFCHNINPRINDGHHIYVPLSLLSFMIIWFSMMIMIMMNMEFMRRNYTYLKTSRTIFALNAIFIVVCFVILHRG